MPLPVASMTGFAHADGQVGDTRWTWEIKSVNGRNLDIRFRVPTGCETVEVAAREVIMGRCRRGHVTANLQVTRSAEAVEVLVNHELLDRLLALADELCAEGRIAPPRLDGLLAMRGVVEIVEPEEGQEARASRESAMMETFQQALESFVTARGREGFRLAELLAAHVNQIEMLTQRASDCAATQPAALRQRLTTLLAELAGAVPPLPEERVAQEVALLLIKADVREELDRLRAHVAEARESIDRGEAIGRKLDFLAQEFNREANTLCAKSSDAELTRVGLELKAVIDRFREQAQNVE